MPIEQMEAESMTGKEIINLIDRLEDEGLDHSKIIEIIRYVELTDPHERRKKKDSAQ